MVMANDIPSLPPYYVPSGYSSARAFVTAVGDFDAAHGLLAEGERAAWYLSLHTGKLAPAPLADWRAPAGRGKLEDGFFQIFRHRGYMGTGNFNETFVIVVKDVPPPAEAELAPKYVSLPPEVPSVLLRTTMPLPN